MKPVGACSDTQYDNELFREESNGGIASAESCKTANRAASVNERSCG